jgi:acyl-CoA synthetase (AMP-forming)/AMP-acid ligase II
MWVYPEIRHLADLVTYHASRAPQKPALMFGAERYDFARLEIESNQAANALVAAGVEPGGRVAFLGKNSVDFFVALFGAAKSGGCFVPLNWRLAAAELAQVVADCRPVFAIVEREFESIWLEICAAARLQTEYVMIDDETRLAAWSGGASAMRERLKAAEDDAVIQLYTSGTTGTPKGVVHTHASFNHSRLSEHLEPAYDWREGDVFLYALPNFHLLGIALSLQCLYNGVALAIQRQFHPAEYLAGVERYRPTLLVLTPTMIQMMIEDPAAGGTDFSSVRLLMYAGSPISLGLLKRAIAIMPCQFMQFYGQTETSGPVSLLRPDEHDLNVEQTLKSCGRPLPLIRLRVVDESGVDVADGKPGELLICAPSSSAGYWQNPAETDAKFKSGWYYTGDVAYRDAAGLFYIYDRVKDMIVSGGENIYCAEIENVLSLHPAVSAVAVIGVPHPKWGEAVKAVVVLLPDQVIGAEALLGFCRAHLAAYKVPKSVDFVEALPITGTGKISKKDLRAPYWAHLQRSVA